MAGVIGTNCSAAAVAASPVISAAGLVMISPSNTSPRLTSDLAGNANPDYHAGYFRVSSNDLHQARALSDFVYHQLELRNVATVHDGDPYTSALVTAFADVFSARGGNVPAQAEIEKGDTDMTDHPPSAGKMVVWSPPMRLVIVDDGAPCCHLPAVCISTIEAPPSASDCASPTRRL